MGELTFRVTVDGDPALYQRELENRLREMDGIEAVGSAIE